MTYAESLVAELAQLGVEVVWAVQGGSIAAFLDAAERHPTMRVRYAPTELAAGWCADGANRAAGCLVAATACTTGPGVWGVMPALLGSLQDGVPCLCIAGAPRRYDGFQLTWGLPPWAAGHVAQVEMDTWLRDEACCIEHLCFASELGGFYESVPTPSFLDWLDRVLPSVTPEAEAAVLAAASDVGDDDLVFSDAGLTLAHVYRVLSPGLGGHLHAPWSQAPMGAAVYQACGAAEVTEKRCWAIVGDGSMGMQVHGPGVVGRYNLNVDVVVMDNDGYGAIRLYQDKALGGRHYGTDPWPWNTRWPGNGCVRGVRAPW